MKSIVSDFHFEVLLQAVIFFQQFFMVVLKVLAQLPEGLNQFVKAL